MLYAGTDRGLFAVGSTEPARWPGRAVSAVARGPDGLCAVLDGHEVSRGDRGVGRLDERQILTLAATARGIWLGTDGAHLYFADTSERAPVAQVRGFERAPERDRWGTPWGGPADTRSIAVGPAGTLYVNVHVGGIVRSRDGGESWEQTIDIDVDVHQVTIDPSDPRHLLAATGTGFARSDDGGDSWHFENDGLPHRYLRAVCIADGAVLVTASRGPHSGMGIVCRRDLGASRFETCSSGLPTRFDDVIDTHCLAAEGRRVAFAAPDGSIYASADTGRSWERLGAGLPPARCLIFA